MANGNNGTQTAVNKAKNAVNAARVNANAARVISNGSGNVPPLLNPNIPGLPPNTQAVAKVNAANVSNMARGNGPVVNLPSVNNAAKQELVVAKNNLRIANNNNKTAQVLESGGNITPGIVNKAVVNATNAQKALNNQGSNPVTNANLNNSRKIVDELKRVLPGENIPKILRNFVGAKLTLNNKGKVVPKVPNAKPGFFNSIF